MKALISIYAAGTLAISPCHAICAQRANDPPGVALVRRLYADYACEAVLDYCDSTHELIDQPRPVLERYFDSSLASLWIADRVCEARTHEICKIDFMPMWNSQDATGTTVRVLAGKDSTQVRVELWNVGAQEPRVLSYFVTRTARGWRIHDIAFGKEWSLVTLLSAKH